MIAESIGYGVLMGAAAGVVAALVQRRAARDGDEEQATWRFLLSLASAALAYGLAAPLGGSGFIAAFVAGMVFGVAGAARRHADPLPAEDPRALLNALTFIAFGAAFMKPLIERATWQEALYALLSLSVVRRCRWRSRCSARARVLRRSPISAGSGPAVWHRSCSR